MSEEHFPYVAEYARSGRSSCRKCHSPIAKDNLRLGIMVKSLFTGEKVPHWYHFKCFFAKECLKSTGQVKYFAALRYEDQEKIHAMVGKEASEDSATRSKTKVPFKAKSSRAAFKNKFSLDYARSSRSICKLCNERIMRGAIRVSKLDTESAVAMHYGPSPTWHHLECFAKMKNVLGCVESGSKLPGFQSLCIADKPIVKKELKVCRKRKADTESDDIPAKVPKKVDQKEVKALKAQSTLFFSYYDQLRQHLTKNQMSELLKINIQKLPSGESELLNSLADCLTFGALNPCPECKGQLTLGSCNYHCCGYFTGWTKCYYTTETPQRRKFFIPKEYQEKYNFLRSYKYRKRNRVFPTNVDAIPISIGSMKPLENFNIVIVGDLVRGNANAKKSIEELGGKVTKRLSGNTTCILTTRDQSAKHENRIKAAVLQKVCVVEEEFLDAVKEGGAAYLIKCHALFYWKDGPVDISKQSNKTVACQPENKGTKSKIQKVVVKGKIVPDPASGLSGDETHVLELNGVIYSAVLGMVDVKRGVNSFYKLQVLENDNSGYYVFRAWGRVGTTVPNSKLDRFLTHYEAIQKFKKIYKNKTNNDWDNRDNFEKSPGSFYPLDIDYGKEIKELMPGKSKLAEPVQKLICMMFNVETMTKAMMEFEIDLQRMPLGQLSKKQIQSAYVILTEAQQLVQGTRNELKILDVSNRFYTLIPHDFGIKKPPLLDNKPLINSKIEMLESLLEIQVACNLMTTRCYSETEDRIDTHYRQLKTDIEALDRNTKEFRNIQLYLENTHAETHRHYTLQLLEVFKINRHGEFQQYKKYCDNLPNKKLLWHGSRITNFAGILSQGLRIAPPEVPRSGYMFGKGIYFADMVSKSANYCGTNSDNPIGLLLLCEVALGNIYERIDEEYVTTLPENTHSTKGVGETSPDPNESIVEDGVEIPCGKPVKNDGMEHKLLYNEYVVYDVNQVNIKYLLKLKFKWRNNC